MRGRDLVMWSEGQWEASKKTSLDGTDRQTDMATLWPTRPSGAELVKTFHTLLSFRRDTQLRDRAWQGRGRSSRTVLLLSNTYHSRKLQGHQSDNTHTCNWILPTQCNRLSYVLPPGSSMASNRQISQFSPTQKIGLTYLQSLCMFLDATTLPCSSKVTHSVITRKNPPN